MPWIESSGITPDVIMNANAVPSRMTVGHLVETLLGKVCALEGRMGDGTPFTGVSIDAIGKKLKRYGYDESGKETLRCPRTGRRLTARVFVGPCLYQRLKHLAAQKEHTRSRGPLQTLVRQPQEGRTRDGGLRVGEMENDCMQAHGTAYLQNDRMLLESDAFLQYYCSLCGLPADPPRSVHFGESALGRTPYCRNCDSRTSPRLVRLPYATKLCFQELLAMGITPRVVLKSLLRTVTSSNKTYGQSSARAVPDRLAPKQKNATLPNWDFRDYPCWELDDEFFDDDDALSSQDIPAPQSPAFVSLITPSSPVLDNAFIPHSPPARS